MSKLRVEHVPCFLQSEIQGETIPETPDGFPFTATFLDNLLQSCPVVVEIIESESETSVHSAYGRHDNSPIGLHRINSYHGRSYELFTGDERYAGKSMAIWEDHYKNMYSSLSLKGGNFSQPEIIQSLTAPSGYMPYGLQETDSFLRVIRASRMMSEANIGTEKIVRVVEPKVFRATKFDQETDMPIHDEYEYVVLSEFKRRLLIQHWNRIAELPNAFEEFDKASTAINNMSFFITLRAMSIGNRIMDFCGTDSEFATLLEHTFKVLDPTVIHDDGEGPLSIDNKENIEWFCTHQLPTTIGINLAKLHNLGLMHTFPTTGNINALGDLVDLDSVKGEPLGLGDDKLNEEDFYKDLDYILSDTDNQLEMLRFASNFLNIMGPDYRQEVLDNEMQKLNDHDLFICDFGISMIDAYVQTRFGLDEEENVTDENVSALLRFIDLDVSLADSHSYDECIKRLLQKQLKTTDYATLLEPTLIESFAVSYGLWAKETAPDTIRSAIMNELSIQNIQNLEDNLQIELSVFYGSLREISRAETAKLYNDADKILTAPDFTQKINTWVSEHIEDTTLLSHETIVKMIAYGIRETVVNQVYKRAFADIEHPRSFVDYFTEHITPDMKLDSEDHPVVHGIFVNGVIASVWSGVSLGALEAAIKPRGALTLVRHEDIFPTSTLMIESTAEMKLQQIYHNGKIIEELHIKEASQFGDGGVLTFEPHKDDNYVAWTILNVNANELHLHVARKI